MNWQEQLQNLLRDNPDMPQGEECEPIETETAGEDVRQTRRLDIGIERKGRAGKTATLITGWELPDSRLRDIASEMKKRLGVGGAARGGDILIQGDCREKVLAALTAMGFKARIV